MQIWQDYDEEAENEAVAPPEENDTALRSEYLDVIVSDVRTRNDLSFSVQILNTEGKSDAISAASGLTEDI
jgi:staphylococcal nuclease domain-containing protein 1